MHLYIYDIVCIVILIHSYIMTFICIYIERERVMHIYIYDIICIVILIHSYIHIYISIKTIINKVSVGIGGF